MLIPIVGIATIAMTADAVLVVGINGEIDCHHFAWMIMSVMGVVLTGPLLRKSAYRMLPMRTQC